MSGVLENLDAPVVPVPAPLSLPALNLRDELRRGQGVLNILPNPVAMTDDRHRVIGSNAALARLSGLESEALKCLSLPEVFSRLRFDIATDWLLQKVAAQGQWQGEVNMRPGEGPAQSFWLHVQEIREPGADELVHHMVCLFDISLVVMREQGLRLLAETDALTGLANRSLFISRLGEAIELAAQDPGKSPSILFIDLDGFKEVNDYLGHARGDAVLCDAARALQASVRANDMVARMGGDEFVVLLVGASRATLVETAQRINDRLLFDLGEQNGWRITVTCSIGIAVCPRDGHDVIGLLKMADKAMYAAKGLGRNQFCLASEDPDKG